MTRGLLFIIALLTIAESDATAPKKSATRTEYGGNLIHFSLTDGQSGEELYVPSRRLATEAAPDCSPLPPMLHLKFETADGHMDEIDMYPKPEPCDSDAVITTASGEEYPLDCSDSSSYGTDDAVLTLTCESGAYKAEGLVLDPSGLLSFTSITYEGGVATATKPKLDEQEAGCSYKNTDSRQKTGADDEDEVVAVKQSLQRLIERRQLTPEADRMLSHNLPSNPTSQMGAKLWKLDGQPCAGDNKKRSLSMGISVGKGLQNKLGKNGVTNYVTTIFKYANLIYEPQLGVRLVVGQIYLDNQGCASSIGADLERLRKWNKPSKQGLWHRFDTCSGGGVAYLGAICNDNYGAGVSYDISGGKTWLWFAHEVGHNFNGEHPLPQSEMESGPRAGHKLPANLAGVMDYGSSKLNGIFQFNPSPSASGRSRKTMMCGEIRRTRQCSSYKVIGNVGGGGGHSHNPHSHSPHSHSPHSHGGGGHSHNPHSHSPHSHAPTADGFVKCANEGGTCSCKGTVRYTATRNGQTKYAVKSSNGNIACNNGVFGDPWSGVPKTCICKANGGNTGGHLVIDGGRGRFQNTCVSDSSQKMLKNVNIAVQCCDKNTDGCKRKYNNQCIGGEPAKAYTFAQANNMCSARGLRLCNKSCKSTGCGYNKNPVWTRIACNSDKPLPAAQETLEEEPEFYGIMDTGGAHTGEENDEEADVPEVVAPPAETEAGGFFDDPTMVGATAGGAALLLGAVVAVVVFARRKQQIVKDECAKKVLTMSTPAV